MSRRLLAGYLALTIVVLVALEVPLAIVNARTERQDLTAKIARDAYAAASLSEDALQRDVRHSPALQRIAAAYRVNTGGRIVIVDRRGQSIADSRPTTPSERSFGTRPEVAAALRGQTVSGIRRSRTLGTGLLYVAVPVASSGVVRGAVRVTYPTSTLDARVNRYRFALLGVGIVVLLAAAALGLLLARSFARPLRSLERVAARVGEGDLEARASERAGPPEIRRLAGELNRTTAKLASLLGSQEQFVTDASHELRTPLTALRLRLENGDTDAALREADRLGRLVDELLALARADAPGAPASNVDLAAVAARRVEQWEPLAAEYGVRLVASGDGGVVHAGMARVEQVLDNLLSNAIDASPRDAQIVVAVDGSDLHVIDEGPGLTAEQRARAFDRFWRASNEPGSGLGLAIAKRLVELDDGEIELLPAPGGGIDAVVRYRAGSLAVRTGSYIRSRWQR